VIAELRRLIADLRPAALDDLGLAAALESLLDRVERMSGLKTRIQIDVGSERLPAGIEDAAYRIVQEALTNVTKHAGASEVSVTVRTEHDALSIAVTDDGVGLDPSAKTEGFGLIGMRERVALAGGELTLTRGEGAGTVVAARLPIVDLGGARTAV